MKEASYCNKLQSQKNRGKIIGYETQPTIELQPKFKFCGENIRAMTYRPDFVVFHDGLTEYVDVKGMKTEVFKLKWKMLQFKLKNEHGYKLTIV